MKRALKYIFWLSLSILSISTTFADYPWSSSVIYPLSPGSGTSIDIDRTWSVMIVTSTQSWWIVRATVNSWVTWTGWISSTFYYNNTISNFSGSQMMTSYGAWGTYDLCWALSKYIITSTGAFNPISWPSGSWCNTFWVWGTNYILSSNDHWRPVFVYPNIIIASAKNNSTLNHDLVKYTTSWYASSLTFAWVLLSWSSQANRYQAASYSGNVIYVAKNATNYIYISSNSGSSFSTWWLFRAFNSLATNDTWQYLFATTSTWIFRSSNTWSTMSLVTIGTGITAIDTDASGRYVMASASWALFVSSDYWVSFTQTWVNRKWLDIRLNASWMKAFALDNWSWAVLFSSSSDSCTDWIQNQDEIAIDYGGVCWSPVQNTLTSTWYTTCYELQQAFSWFTHSSYTWSVDYNADWDTLFDKISWPLFLTDLSWSVVATWTGNVGTEIGTFQVPYTSTWYYQGNNWLNYVTLSFSWFVPIVEARLIYETGGIFGTIQVNESDEWTRLNSESLWVVDGVRTMRFFKEVEWYPILTWPRESFWTFRVTIPKLGDVSYYWIDVWSSVRVTRVSRECTTISRSDYNTYSWSLGAEAVGIVAEIGTRYWSWGNTQGWSVSGSMVPTVFGMPQVSSSGTCVLFNNIVTPSWLNVISDIPYVPDLLAPLRCVYQFWQVIWERFLAPMP